MLEPKGERKRLEDIVFQAAQELGEHFEAVQILASFTDGDGTACIKKGNGNWYARQGMAQEFRDEENGQVIAHEINKVATPPDEDGESWKQFTG